MVRLIYNLLWLPGLICFLPGYLLKMFRRGGYRKNFGQRLSFYSAELRGKLQSARPIWIHAVSVGEVRIALKLAQALRVTMPGRRVVLSATTTTGYALAQKSSAPWLDVIYFPLDFWLIMRRAFSTINPSGIVLIEAEVWPNLVAEAVRRKIPVILANARLSPRSEASFRKFKFFVTPIFQKLDCICVPTKEDVARWRALGVSPARVRVLGSIKYDAQSTAPSSIEPQRLLENLGINPDRPILLGGSTHRGEEIILAETFLRLRTEFPSLFLVLAPRHVERATEIETDLRRAGIQLARRSKEQSTSPDGLLIDTTGELRDWYSVTTVVFMGKSLRARGGQNPVEAIVAGKPVIFGPHMENFSQLARQLLENDGAIAIASPAELLDRARELFGDASLREKIAVNALRVIAAHNGATERTAELMNERLETEPCNG